MTKNYFLDASVTIDINKINEEENVENICIRTSIWFDSRSIFQLIQKYMGSTIYVHDSCWRIRHSMEMGYRNGLKIQNKRN